MEDPLRTLAEKLVADKQGISEEVRLRMVDELVAAMERHINAEMIARLDDAQVDEFVKFMETNPPDDKVVEFFTDRGVNVNAAVTSALANFKEAYIGK